jgi:hypothetical protein
MESAWGWARVSSPEDAERENREESTPETIDVGGDAGSSDAGDGSPGAGLTPGGGGGNDGAAVTVGVDQLVTFLGGEDADIREYAATQLAALAADAPADVRRPRPACSSTTRTPRTPTFALARPGNSAGTRSRGRTTHARSSGT